MKEKIVTTQLELEYACIGGFVAVVKVGSFTAYGSSQVRAYGSSQVTACGSSQVTAYDSSQVTACDSSQVRACDSSQVMAYNSSQVTACNSSQVRAYGSSQVRAYGSSQVTACDSSQVRAYNSSQVRAYNSSQVRAYGSSQVTACGSSQVRAYDSSQVRASKWVAVSKHGNSCKVVGGHVIKIINPVTLAQWIAFHGVKVKNGVAIVFKGVSSEFKSNFNQLDYTPGTTPKAPDWDNGKAECGGGLHFSPYPIATLKTNFNAKKFVACPVRVKDMRRPKADDEYPEKIKASGCCAPVWECDINGNPIKKS